MCWNWRTRSTPASRARSIRVKREFYLREQMRQIQNELGEGDIFTRDVVELKDKIEAAKLPEEPKGVAMKELERLNQMPPMAPEIGIIRTYIDWIIDLPWKNSTPDNLDVKHAARVLERDHYGLKKAKERILEYIAVRSLKPTKERQPILCFVGPPGTGKTSLGRSIARRSGASSYASRSEASGMRRRSGDIAAPTSALCPAGLSRR